MTTLECYATLCLCALIVAIGHKYDRIEDQRWREWLANPLEDIDA